MDTTLERMAIQLEGVKANALLLSDVCEEIELQIEEAGVPTNECLSRLDPLIDRIIDSAEATKALLRAQQP